MNIEESILKIIRNNVSREITEVTIESRLIEDLSIDSVDKISIVVDIEKCFQITIKDADLIHITRVRDIIEKVRHVLTKD